MFNKNNRTKLHSYLLPPLITSFGMILIMVIKQIYPFGPTGFGYNDNMNQVVPMYSFIWDVLHGRTSSVYSVQIGMGTDLSVMRSMYSLFSPFNLLLYLIPRGYVAGFISVMTIIKMACMSVTMFFFFNHDRIFSGTSYAFKVLFSVMYAFSGYVLLYASCFSPWMDIVVIFPVFMLGFYKMLYSGKRLMFALMTAAMLAVNSRLAVMGIIYVIVITGGYIIFIVNKDSFESLRDKLTVTGKIAGNTVAAIIAGTGLSAFVLVPIIMRILGPASERTGSGRYFEVLAAAGGRSQECMFRNLMMIYGLAFAFAMIIVGLLFYKQEKKSTRFIIFSLAVTVLPVIFDTTERLWSMRSYDGYSMQFGFITAFSVISAGCYFAGKPLGIEGKNAERRLETSFEPLEKLVYILSGMVLGGIAVYIYNKIDPQDVTEALIYFAFVFLLMLGCNIAMCVVNKGVLCVKSCYVAAAIEIFIGVYAMMGVPQFYPLNGSGSTNYALTAEHAAFELGIEPSDTEAVKNPDMSLGMNYPVIIQRPALTSDFNSYYYNYSDAAVFGYGVYHSGASDAGGTVFSDALLGITEVVSRAEQEDALYLKSSEYNGYKRYLSRFTLPYGMTADSSFLEDTDTDDWVAVNNAFFSAVTGREDRIAGRCQAERQDTGRYILEIEGRSAVYIRLSSKVPLYIDVNDKRLAIPEPGQPDNMLYNAKDDKRLLFLGVFEDEEIEVGITDKNGRYVEAETDAGMISLSKLASVCNMMNSNTGLSAEADKAKDQNAIRLEVIKRDSRDMIILPVTYDTNWRIEINKNAVKPVYIGNKRFIGIKLEEGVNKIEMRYIPQGMGLGIAISIFMALVIIGLYYLFKQIALKPAQIILQAEGVLFTAAWLVLMLLLFVIPAINDVICLIMRIF